MFIYQKKTWTIYIVFPQLSEGKNQKWTFILCLYVCCYVTIRCFVLRVKPYFSFANIGIKMITAKCFLEKSGGFAKIKFIFAASNIKAMRTKGKETTTRTRKRIK